MAGQAVRAGQAFVELTSRDGLLQAGLKKAMARARRFAAEATKVGRLSLTLGGGFVGALVALAKAVIPVEQLKSGFSALKDAVGQALAPALVPIVELVSKILMGLAQWVKENPATVQAILAGAAAFAAFGAAVLAIGLAVTILSSPITLIVGLITLVGSAFLALTDVLGLTDTGFGDLFNSVRINGQGLATWMGKLVLFIEQLWVNLQKTVNDIATGLIKRFSDFLPEGAKTGLGVLIGLNSHRLGNAQTDIDSRLAALNAADPPRESDGAFSIDKSKAKAAFEKIGGNIIGAVKSGLEDVAEALPFEVASVPAVVAQISRSVEVSGSFGATAANRLGFGQNLQERAAHASEETAKNTRKILDEVRLGGATFT